MKKISIAILVFITFINLQMNAQRTGITYTIESSLESKNLTVKNGETSNGTPLLLWSKTNREEQQFTLEDAGNGFFYIKSQLGQYIHVQGGSSQAKALALMWNGKGNDNTKWKFENLKNGYVAIRSKKGTYLDVQWGKSDNGTPIWLWNYNGGKAQQWKLKKSASTSSRSTSRVGVGYNAQGEVIKTVTPKAVKGLCPHSLVSGDLEFGGNGPKVYGSIMLIVSESQEEIQAQITFNARETAKDMFTGRSEVKGFWKAPIYTAPQGMKISKIVSNDLLTKFEKVLKGGGASQIFGGGADGSPHFLTIGDGLENKGKVSQIELVGDTGGWDISTDNDCTNDTRILEVKFKPIKIELVKK